ncbi:hypothetical protein NMY22_g12285 [Coprinellus aureogranulatus]|nr:hypothetical protein NMY22_g12285 [Coprinellus aureogranulatus]
MHGASTPSLVQDNDVVTRQQSPSSTRLLPPRGRTYNGQPSEDVPPSPVPSDMSDSTITPPSPQLCPPDEESCTTSLGLLSLGNAWKSGSSSSRRPNNTASITGMGDDGRSDSEPRHVDSTAIFTTHVDAISAAYSSEDAKASDSELSDEDKKSKKKEEEGKTTHQAELEQNPAIDPTPFAYQPHEPAHTLNPKNLDALASFGRGAGLLRALRANTEGGLSTSARTPRTRRKTKDKVPEIFLTTPGGDTTTATPPADPKASQASLADRKRVYGENVIPNCPSKTLLQQCGWR